MLLIYVLKFLYIVNFLKLCDSLFSAFIIASARVTSLTSELRHKLIFK